MSSFAIRIPNKHQQDTKFFLDCENRHTCLVSRIDSEFVCMHYTFESNFSTQETKECKKSKQEEMCLSLPCVFPGIGKSEVQITHHEQCNHGDFLNMQTVANIFTHLPFHQNIIPEDVQITARVLIMLCIHKGYDCLSYMSNQQPHFEVYVEFFEKCFVRMPEWNIVDNFMHETIELAESATDAKKCIAEAKCKLGQGGVGMIMLQCGNISCTQSLLNHTRHREILRDTIVFIASKCKHKEDRKILSRIIQRILLRF